MQPDGTPACGGIIRPDEEMYGTGPQRIRCFSWIPPGTDGYFYFSIAINIPGSNAYIVSVGKIVDHDESFPVAVAIPHKLFFIGQQDILFPIAIDITRCNTVSNLNIVVDRLRLKLWLAIRCYTQRCHPVK